MEQVYEINMGEFELGAGAGTKTPGLWYKTAAVLEATGHPVRATYISSKVRDGG